MDGWMTTCMDESTGLESVDMGGTILFFLSFFLSF